MEAQIHSAREWAKPRLVTSSALNSCCSRCRTEFQATNRWHQTFAVERTVSVDADMAAAEDADAEKSPVAVQSARGQLAGSRDSLARHSASAGVAACDSVAG